MKTARSSLGSLGGTLAMGCCLTLVCAARYPVATGVLEGVVRLGGDSIPGPTLITNTTDPGVCSERQSLEDLVVSAGGQGVAHVIVSLVDAPAGVSRAAATDVQNGPLVLDNVDCRFRPHAAVLTVGDTIVATNSDALLHTVHYYGALTANLSLPRRGLRRTVVTAQPGMITVKCDVHGWMQAFIRIDPHRFHTVTDEEGRFRIAGIPVGEYTVELWHERLGTITRTFVIEDGGTTTLAVEFDLSPSA